MFFPVTYTYDKVFCLFSFLFMAISAAYGSSRLGAELELQLLAYTTATGTQDPSYI